MRQAKNSNPYCSLTGFELTQSLEQLEYGELHNEHKLLVCDFTTSEPTRGDALNKVDDVNDKFDIITQAMWKAKFRIAIKRKSIQHVHILSVLYDSITAAITTSDKRDFTICQTLNGQQAVNHFGF